jgi:hypothetical protein
MNKYFREVIVKNALGVKHLMHISGAFAEQLIEENPQFKTQFKNVCAPIPLALNEELENVTGILGLSKRDFLTMAIASAIDEAKVIMDDIDIDEYLADQVDRQPALKVVK